MASGHVNRIKRPNTWLYRPACGREESPCQLGAVPHALRQCALSGASDVHGQVVLGASIAFVGTHGVLFRFANSALSP